MLQKIKEYYYNLNNGKFSVLADLGDLSRYSFKQMNHLLNDWNISIQKNDIYFDVTWENNNTLLIIRYEKITENFLKIIDEKWKSYNTCKRLKNGYL
jgi:hypothetical protein